MRLTKKLLVIATSLPAMTTTAFAQTGVPMPSPMDVIIPRGELPRGSCGKTNGTNLVRNEVQEVYARAKRCTAFKKSDYFDYLFYIRDFDNDDRTYGNGVVGDYETVANYFNYYGIAWWDGRTSPGYRETARRAGQVPPGLTARYAGTATTTPAPAPATTRRQAAPQATSSATGAVGACGIPVSTGLTAQAQAEAQRIGTCDQIRQIYGVQ